MRKRLLAISMVGVVCTIGLVRAKAPTVKLEITGPRLSAPVEVTDADALVSVWDDRFLLGTADPPGASAQRYTISFYIGRPESPAKAYVIYYAQDPSVGHGVAYLPGRGEQWYSLNAHTILRAGQEGKWHHVSARWSKAIRSHLP